MSGSAPSGQTIAEMLYERGFQKGLEEALQEARQMLLGMLVHQFGELPEEIGRRVMTADRETLMRWGLRLVSGCGLDEMFAA